MKISLLYMKTEIKLFYDTQKWKKENILKVTDSSLEHDDDSNAFIEF
jgi:hypothetical protein